MCVVLCVHDPCLQHGSGQALRLAPCMTAERHQGGDPFLRQLPGDGPRRHCSAGRGQVPVNAPNTRVATWCHCQRADFATTASDCRANLCKPTEAPSRGCAAAFSSFRAESRNLIIADTYMLQVQGGGPRPDHCGHLRAPQAERSAVRGDAGGRRRRRAGGSWG